MPQQTVMIVDDEVNITQSFVRLFRKLPIKVVEAHSGEEALRQLDQSHIDVIVSDQRMPGMTGAELFAKVRQTHPNTMRLLLSGYTDFQALTYAINNGAISEFISKPWDRDALMESVQRALDKAEQLTSNNAYDQVFRQASDGVLLLDGEFIIRDVNPAHQRQTGYAKTDLEGLSLFDAIPELDRQVITHDTLSEGCWDGELWLLRKDRSLGLFSVSIRPLADSGRYSVHCMDITALRRNELSSRHDLLTGLLNRASFQAELSNALEESSPFGLISVDLLRFRQVNESLGYEVGDELLCEVAIRLRECFAALDARNRVARVGGDEFAVLCFVDDIQSELATRCDDWLAQFGAPLRIQNQELFIHFNIGLATFDPGDSATPEELSRQAATARHRVRSHQQVPYLFYSEEMLVGAKELLQLHNDLHKVITNNELILLYQPKVDVTTGLTHSVEALVRWHHPEKGLISPNHFVFLAEESGLIIDIGDWCIGEALRQLHNWRCHGLMDVSMAINLSPRQFSSPALYAMLKTLKERYQLPEGCIELEITESTLLDDVDRAAEVMGMIRDLGIEFALDDFGTGYASFDYLKRFPFSTLKIDRSFVRSIAENPKDQSIVESMIKMAHQLGQRVVAEGVEVRDQAKLLAGMRCDLIQGYLYSRPMPANLMEARLTREKSRKH